MPIGGGGLNGNQNNPGVNSVGTNPSLAGPSAVTPTATASNFSSGGSTATPGLGGATPTAIRPTATASNFAPTPGVGGTGQSNTAFNNTGSGEQAPTAMTGTVAGSVAPGAGTSTAVKITPTMTGGFNPTATTGGLAPYVPGTAFDPAVDGKTNVGPATYGNGHQTLGEFQTEQANTFNANQLAGQQAWNQTLAGMPYNTQINASNPYDQFVANPATPGHGSAAFQSPANQAAWQASGLQSQLANPTAGFAQSQPQNSNYGQNQLLFLLNTLQRYGQGGQNPFGNSFSPTFTGQGTQGGLSQTSTPGASSNGFSLNQLLPLLMGLAQNGQSQGPAPGSYGNLGNSANSYTPDPYYQPGGQGYAKGYTAPLDPYYLPGGQGYKLGYTDPNYPNGPTTTSSNTGAGSKYYIPGRTYNPATGVSTSNTNPNDTMMF